MVAQCQKGCGWMMGQVHLGRNLMIVERNLMIVERTMAFTCFQHENYKHASFFSSVIILPILDTCVIMAFASFVSVGQTIGPF